MAGYPRVSSMSFVESKSVVGRRAETLAGPLNGVILGVPHPKSSETNVPTKSQPPSRSRFRVFGLGCGPAMRRGLLLWGWWEMSKSSLHVDMTKGVYRRLYSGLLTSRKVNSVSIEAEHWYIRLMLLVDDYGNIRSEWRWLAINVSPIRDVTKEQAELWTMDLARAGLVQLYQSEGDQFLHVVGFMEYQPGGKNGKRVARWPVYPGESGCIQMNPDESRCIPVNAGEPGQISISTITTTNTTTMMKTRDAASSTDRVNTPVDSICQAIEAKFVTPKGEPLAGAGEMYQARERISRLLADSWRTGTCADFTPELVALIAVQKFASVRGAVNFIESVCRRCRRDDCLPGDPMKGGKGLVVERESEPEVSDVWSKVQ